MTPPQVALVDANIVLRFVTGTPTHQAEAAARLFARAQAGDVDLVLMPPVVAEVVYVLEGVYDYGSERVQAELLELLDTGCFRVRDEEAIRRALVRRVTTPVDFVDVYVSEVARREGFAVATFDRDFERLGVNRLQVA